MKADDVLSAGAFVQAVHVLCDKRELRIPMTPRRQDFVRAHMWFDLAATASSNDSGDRATKHKEEIAAKMTAEQIGTAQGLARRCQESNFKNCD